MAFPTETVYGLGADATNDDAVRAIYAAKGRPSDNPLIVHVPPEYDVSNLVYITESALKLTKAYLPGPLTMVYKSKGKVSPLVSCGLDTLAVRVPAHRGAARFLRAAGVPIAAPSANVSKHVSPVTARHVYDDLAGKIPLILDGGSSCGGIESTVLDVTGEVPVILRSGLVTFDMIKAVAGRCEYVHSTDGPVRSPGMKYKHYSPRAETAYFERDRLAEAVSEYKSALNRGLSPIFICDDKIAAQLEGMEYISLGSTSEQLAANVYTALRQAEKTHNFIIGVALKGDSQVDVGVMNRFVKAMGGKT